jgi:hypothetical protein
MAEEKRGRPKRIGGRAIRSEVVQIRLDPKIRYIAELSARRHRRTLSNYIEWAIEQSFKNVLLRENPEAPHLNVSIAQRANTLWDVYEADRFIKLTEECPDLLTHEEQILLKLIHACDFLWRKPDETLVSNDRRWLSPETHLIFERLREHWDAFKAVAKGDADISTLPGMPSDAQMPEP